MLQLMRTGAKSLVIKVFLFGLLLCAMLGLALISDVSAFNSSAHRNYVAKMDGAKISIQEFDRFVQGEIRARGMTAEQAYMQGIPQSLLQGLVKDRLIARSVHDMGLNVDDTTAAIEIKKILSDAVKSGMSEKEALNSLLSQTGLSERQLVNSIKTDAAANIVIGAIVKNASVPEMLVNDAIKLRHETRQGRYFTISADKIGKIAAPSAEALKKIYDDNGSQFMLPEYRSFSVLLLDKKALGVSDTVSDADIKSYYDQNKREFTMPETRELRQVVIADEAEAGKVADAARKNGLDDAIKQYAPKSKIILQSYEEAALPVEFASDAFSAKDGEIIGPVKTPFGWHVIAAGKKQAPGPQPFEKVSADIREKLKSDNGASALYNKANAIDDMVSKGQGLPEIAAQYNLQEKNYSKLDMQSMTQNGKKSSLGLPAEDKILATVFTLESGETSQLIELPDNAGFAIIEVREIVPPQAQPFESVRSDVEKIYKANEERALLDKKAAEISERLGMGESFEKVAEGLKAVVTSSGSLSRANLVAKPGLDRDVQSALFSLQKKGEAKIFPSEGRILVVKLEDRKIDAAKASSSGDEKSVSSLLKQAEQNALMDQYTAYLVKKYDAEIYPEVVADLYAPKGE